MGKLLGAWSRDYLRGGVIYLAAAVVVIPLACCLVLAPLFLVQGGNFSNTTTLLILVVPMGLFFLITIGGALFVGYRMISRRAHWMDEAIAPLGLEGSSYAFSGRQYHGTYQGRQVDILFYRGPTLSMFVGTPLKTKLGVGERNRLGQSVAKAFNREPLQTSNPDLENMFIYAHDPAWGQKLIDQSEATAVLNRLVHGETDFLYQQVHLYPDAFLYRLYRTKGLFDFKISAQQIQSWYDDVVRLAEIAESLPAPQEALEASRLEQASRTGGAAKWAVWIGVGIVLLLLLCGIVPVVVGLLLALASG